MLLSHMHGIINLVGWLMVFNTTFNNISVISWRSVMLVEETGVPEKTTDLSKVIPSWARYQHVLEGDPYF